MRVMKRLLFASGVLVLLCHTAHGQSCDSYSRSYGRSYSYSYPSYSYSTPSYSYATPAYVAPTKVYKEEPSYIRFWAVLPLVELPSYSAAYVAPSSSVAGSGVTGQQALKAPSSEMQELKSQNVQILSALKSIDDSVKRLESRVDNLERSGRYGPPPQALPKQEAPRKEEQAPAPKQETPPDDGGKVSAASVNRQMCAACHQKGNEQHGGDFVLSDEKGLFVKLTDSQLVAMGRQLGKGKMPKLNARAKEHNITRALAKAEAEALFAEIDRQINVDAKQ